MSLELYSTCISVLQNFGFFLSTTTKITEFREIRLKFRRNFEPWTKRLAKLSTNSKLASLKWWIKNILLNILLVILSIVYVIMYGIIL